MSSSMKTRKFSLDSCISMRGSRSSHKSKLSTNIEEAQQEIHDLAHSLNKNSSIRDQVTTEDPDRPNGLLTTIRHNKSFHKLFPDTPEEEVLTDTFTCALQKEVLYHGKLFVSENYVCFHSSVLLKETKVVIPVSSISQLKKQKPALSILSIYTVNGGKYSFVHMRNREVCYNLLQSACSHIQVVCRNNSPHVSASENSLDAERISSHSSADDSMDQSLRRQDSHSSDDGFRLLSNRAPGIYSSSPYTMSVSCYKEETAGNWMWSIVGCVASLLPLTETNSRNALSFIVLLLILFLLLASMYIGLRIIALQEQLNALEALNEILDGK